MSVARARELVARATTDPALLKQFQSISLEERRRLVADLGYADVTDDDLQGLADQVKAEREELTEAELEQVAGGGQTLGEWFSSSGFLSLFNIKVPDMTGPDWNVPRGI
jgi:predicted ribosomally synthesized peptide with nif11-like leader